jgi:hypothetical protein
MKAYGKTDLLLHIFLTLPLGSVEWSASSHGRFTRGEMLSGTKRIRDWVGYGFYLGVLGNIKPSLPCRIRKENHRARNLLREEWQFRSGVC